MLQPNPGADCINYIFNSLKMFKKIKLSVFFKLLNKITNLVVN